MCTIGYLAKSGLVFKNRDKQEIVAQELIVNDKLVTVRTVGENYYAAGMNGHGCGFVTAAVGRRLWPNEWLLPKETELKTPSKFLSDTLADRSNIDDWLEYLRRGKCWQGFNLVLFEPGKVFFVLLAGAKVEIRQCQMSEIHTNHFSAYPGDNKIAPGTGSCDSFARLTWAKANLSASTTVSGLQQVLTSVTNSAAGGLWLTEPTGGLVTVSSIIFDIIEGKVSYSDNPDNWRAI